MRMDSSHIVHFKKIQMEKTYLVNLVYYFLKNSNLFLGIVGNTGVEKTHSNPNKSNFASKKNQKNRVYRSL